MRAIRLLASSLALAAGCSADRECVECGMITVTTLEVAGAEGPAAARVRAAGPCDADGDIVGNIPVVIHAPDGTDSLLETDGNGLLTVELEPGSAVTASYGANACGGQQFLTFLDVIPGDDLRFGTWELPVGDPVAEMTVTWPAQMGIDHFELVHSCNHDNVPGGGTATSAIVPFFEACSSASPAPDRGDVVVVGYADAQLPVLWAQIAGFEIVDGGVLQIDAFLPATTQTVEMSGIPASVRNAWINISPHIGGNMTIRPFVSASGSPVDNRLARSGPWVPAADRVEVEAGFEGMDYGTQYLYARAPATEPLLVANPPLIPWMDAGSVVIDVTARTMQWSQTGQGVYDGAIGWMAWARQRADGWDFFQWTIIGPPGVTSFPIPELPDELAELGPGVDDQIDGGISLLEVASADGRLPELPLWEILYAGFDHTRDDFPLTIVSAP